MATLETFILIFLLTNIILSDSYRILGVFPFQSKSHQMLFDALAKGLSIKGHRIDFMTVYPLKQPIPNYKVVVNLENISESLVNKWDVKFASELGDDTLPIIAVPFGNGLCEYLSLPEVQNIIKNPPKDPPYDLVIVESFGANCFIGLGYALNVPVIMASTTIDLPWLGEAIGQPKNSAFFPNLFSGYSHPMSFLQRTRNFLLYYISNMRYRYFTESIQNEQMRKYINPNIPNLRELEKEVVLALVNSFHSLNGVRPLTPGLIEIAGLHVQDDCIEPSEELKKWLNNSEAGIIYFTLGSMVNIETFPNVTIKAFYTVFSRLAPRKVLMKVANKERLLPGLPDNVKTSSWIPQVTVLSHKNTKVFITHGGLMSSQEALTFGIPMIGIPLFGDQHNNIDAYKKIGMALKLDHCNLTEESISYTLNEILNNPKYKKAAEYQSRRFLDRPMNPMDTAIYWIEYAIRNGKNSLRSPIVDMPWWQVELLDVYAFLFLSFIFSAFSLLLLFKLCLKLWQLIQSGKIKSD